MGLEQALVCRKALAKLRNGPLGHLLDGFCDWLLDRGFARYTIRNHLSNVAHFSEHLGQRRAAPYQAINRQDVEGFLASYPPLCRHRSSREAHLRRVRYSINRFVEYLFQEGLFDPLPRRELHQSLLDSYLEWMRTHQHTAAGTLGIRARSLTQFLRWLGPKATPEGLNTLDPSDVETFFLSYAQDAGRATRRSMQSALRTFFRFCLYQGYIHEPLDLAVPTLRTYKLASVPQGLSDAQAKRVLECIDRKTKVGQRDYAIIQLLYTYGIRGCQVRELRLKHIDWTRNLILFEASKGGKESRLPLTPEVGESLLDYLRNARPPTSYSQVFLTSRAPYHPLPRSSTLSAIIDRYVRVAGIEILSKGSHAFRHCFATRMLKQGHSLKSIADVLGHRHLGTTFIYTKVDFNSLKQVGLELPEEVAR